MNRMKHREIDSSGIPGKRQFRVSHKFVSPFPSIMHVLFDNCIKY